MSHRTGLSPRELQSRALSGATWSTVSSTISLPLSIVVSVVLARSLGPTQFARFAYLTFLVPLLLSVTDLGFSHATTRNTSRTFAAGDVETTRDLLGKVLGWNLLRTPLVVAVAIVVSRPTFPVACMLAGVLAVSAASTGLLFALHAENRGAANAKLAFLQGVTSGVAAMIAATAGGSGTTVWAVNLVSGLVAAPGWLLIANPSLRRAALTPRLPRTLPHGFWRYGVNSLILALITTLVFSRSEIVVLQVLGHQHALAVFALAYGLSQRLTAPVDTLLGPLIPALSALGGAHPERMRSGFGRAVRLSFAAVAFLAGGAGVGTMLVAPVLFGPKYAGVGAAFAALATVSLLQSAAQPYTALAHALGRPGILIRAHTVALVVDVALAFALIPPLGLWGAVIANAAGGLVALALTVRAAPAAERVTRAELPILRLALSTVPSVLIAYVLGAAVGQFSPAAGAVLAFAAGALCFAGMARIFGGLLPPGDAAVVLNALPSRLARLSRPMLAMALTPDIETGT